MVEKTHAPTLRDRVAAGDCSLPRASKARSKGCGPLSRRLRERDPPRLPDGETIQTVKQLCGIFKLLQHRFWILH